MICKFLLCAALILSTSAQAQIGKRFPSERKVVKDPVTGVMLTFLTSKPHDDSKIYPTHPQWTADGQWVVFRSGLAHGEAMAVNEQSGEIVQITEGGYTGMLNLARKSMKLYFMRKAAEAKRLEIVEVNLAALLADSAAGNAQSCRRLPARLRHHGGGTGSRRRHGAGCRRGLGLLLPRRHGGGQASGARRQDRSRVRAAQHGGGAERYRAHEHAHG
jgi:hypothetical protein